MYMEDIANIDEGDQIAFVDDLPFDRESIFDVREEEKELISWYSIHKVEFTGSLYRIYYTLKGLDTTLRLSLPFDQRVIVRENED